MKKKYLPKSERLKWQKIGDDKRLLFFPQGRKVNIQKVEGINARKLLIP